MLNHMSTLKRLLTFIGVLLFTCGNHVHADYVFKLGLDPPQVTGSNQVTVSVFATFTGDTPTDYVDAITLNFLNSSPVLQESLPSNDQYTRISFANVLTGWNFLGLDTTNGLALFNNSTLSNTFSDRLVDIVIDTTGLSAIGTYDVSIFKDGYTNASGVINDGMSDVFVSNLADPTGLGVFGTADYNSPGTQSFSITAVPEPSSLLYGIAAGTFGMLMRNRRKLKARVRNQ